MHSHQSGKLPDNFLIPGSSSFFEFVSRHSPELLTRHIEAAIGSGAIGASAPHGTTIVAVCSADGVVMAGDRRATMGSMIASRDIEKVFSVDHYSVVGIAGSAGIALELIKLFQLELEHFEKIEGSLLSLDGKANRLATMIRSNLGLALQGLATIPLFAGYDTRKKMGRIFSYDITGGRYEEQGYDSVGSGSVFAKSALKKLWQPELAREDAIRVAVEALYDAADDDSATGGPDTVRGLWPTVVAVTESGCAEVTDAELSDISNAIIMERKIKASTIHRKGDAS